MAGYCLPLTIVKRIEELSAGGMSSSEIATKLGVNRNTVAKYRVRHSAELISDPMPNRSARNRESVDLPPSFDEPGVDLPPSLETDRSSIHLTKPGVWGILSDIHIPCHDNPTLRLFAVEARRRGVVGILLNGDVLDMYQISDHLRNPAIPAIKHEIDCGRQFMGWLRGQFPKAEVVYREGNHEERFRNYLFRHAPQLCGLDEISVSSLLHLDTQGIQYVQDRRLVELGKLPILHGHEYKHGVTAPVNPARGLFLRTKTSAMVGHHHQVSVHTEKDVRGKPIKTWSLGCVCKLKADYMPYNNWSHGFAFVDVAQDCSYHVQNHQVLDGRLV
jgi:predicted phosphodiesterase